jgi:hypothetical protein
MATITLPIRELERSVCLDAEKARIETKRVVKYSTGNRADFLTALKIIARTLILKLLLGTLVRQQEKLIKWCINADFTVFSDEELVELAFRLDKIVVKERDVLDTAYSLGTELRVWWDRSLSQLSQQVEHLDSIAKSLHLEQDSQTPLLLGMMAEEFSQPDKISTKQ